MFEFTFETCNNRGNVYFDLISCEKWPHDKQEIKRDLNIHIYYSSLSLKMDKLQSTIAIFSQKDQMEFMVLENLGQSIVVMIFRDLITIQLTTYFLCQRAMVPCNGTLMLEGLIQSNLQGNMEGGVAAI